MNAQQRRKQYRAMPKVGATVAYRTRKDGSKCTGVVIGPGRSRASQGDFGGMLPSLHRVFLDTGNGGSCQPRLTNLFAA